MVTCSCVAVLCRRVSDPVPGTQAAGDTLKAALAQHVFNVPVGQVSHTRRVGAVHGTASDYMRPFSARVCQQAR